MHENNQSLLRQPRLYEPGIPYVFELRNHAGDQGYFSMDELCSRLPDAGLLEADLRNNVSLTARGHQFAQWLIENGHKATYFQSNVGTWGVQPTDTRFSWFLNRPGAQPVQKPTAADEGSKTHD